MTPDIAPDYDLIILMKENIIDALRNSKETLSAEDIADCLIRVYDKEERWLIRDNM